MKSVVPVRKIIFITLGAAMIAGAWWTVQRTFPGRGAGDAIREGGPASARTSPDSTAGEEAETIRLKAQKMVEDYADVRRKLQSGELTTLPPDLVPPPVPEPSVVEEPTAP